MKAFYNRNPISLRKLGAIGCILTLGSTLMFADTDTGNIAVSATVVESCTLDGGSLSFGNYDPIVTHASTPLDSTVNLSVLCTEGTTATIGLSDGDNAVSGQRKMAPAAGTERLNYNLYSDSGRTAAWATEAYTEVDGTSATNVTVYGRVPAGQNTSAAGSYTDTVVATITFN